MKPAKKISPFSRQTFFIPFGRFRADRKFEEVSAEVFVGREGQRAFLIDALTGVGKRGAYLVTGRRGVGKTTFVEHCLEEYQSSVFRRQLRSGVGRSPLELAVLAGLFLAFLFILLTASDLLEFVVPQLADNGLLSVLMIVSTAIVALPFLYGVYVFRQVFLVLAPRWSALLAFLVTVIAICVATFFFPSGSPAFSLALLIICLAAMALGVHFGSFCKRAYGRRGVGGLTAGALIAASVVGFVFTRWISSSGQERYYDSGIVLAGMIVGPLVLCILMGAQSMFALFYSHKARGGLLIPNSKNASEPVRPDLKSETARHIGLRSGVSALIGMVLLTGIATLLNLSENKLVEDLRTGIPKYWGVSFGIMVVFAARYWVAYVGQPLDGWALETKDSELRRRFVPAGEALLLFKGFTAIVLSLQLAYPLVGVVPGVSELLKPTDHIVVGESLSLRPPTSLTYRLTDAGGKSPVDEAAGAGEAEDLTFYTVFSREGSDETLWILFALILGFMIYHFEYEWINRPFIAQRQALALDRGPRRDYQPQHHMDPSWKEAMRKQDTENGGISDDAANDASDDALKRRRPHLFRALEKASFPYFVAKTWLPSIFVRVNLGFDRLDHRGVTHAMLFGLSNAYRRRFNSWRSVYFVIGQSVLFLTILIIVVMAGRSFFDMPYRPVAMDDIKLTNALVSLRQDDQSEQTNDPQANGAASIGSQDNLRGQGPVISRDVNNSRLSYCRWLYQVQLERASAFSRPANMRNTQERILTSKWQSQALVPQIACGFNESLADAAMPFFFAPLLYIDLNEVLDPSLPAKLALGSAFYHGHEVAEPEYDARSGAFRPIFLLTHANNGLPVLTERGAANAESRERQAVQDRTLSIRVYHLVIFLILVYLIGFGRRHMPLLPYRRLQQRIEALTEALVQSHVSRRRPGRFGLTRMIGQVFSDEAESENARDKLDPRSVELALMEILEDIQRYNQRSFMVSPLSVSIPTPEVHFIFDELDKVGGVVGADETAFGIGKEEKQAVDAERQRTYALHALLSDMKRVISSAPARFLFVGGRALHDEWVRDINRTGTRQPLLSGIFDAEIYLPSLLLDQPRSIYDNEAALPDAMGKSARAPKRRLDARVREYLAGLHAAACELDTSLQINRHTPFFALPARAVNPGDFNDQLENQDTIFNQIKVIDWRLVEPMADEPAKLPSGRDDKSWLLDDFSRFLAFRSGGSPKKLRELISNLVRPAGAFAQPTTRERFELFGDRDMLVIDQRELYRIQFVSQVFQEVDRNFGSVLVSRDDKVAINVFFLFDYLMKLHGRAFSLSSLERLDELAHIHRVPDLRRMLEKVISASAETYFHRMLNGLYSFRFQSDLAMEVQYLSRISEPEMAALNFTLDESQELKTTYTQMLGVSGEPNPDIISALGELYEYDQAYDVARSYYERALRMVDQELSRQVGEQVGEAAPSNQEERDWSPLVRAVAHMADVGMFMGSRPVVDLILRGRFEDRLIVSYYMPWAVRRLRLMMQIGLTFEQMGDEERAQAQYYAAHLLARAITDVAFEPRVASDSRPIWDDNIWLKMLLENLTLIYQPLLSSAWVSEKLEGAVDTATIMVEQELIDIARRFDFLSRRTNTQSVRLDVIDPVTGDPKTTAGYAGENFSLVAAELHNKAGDLYFYKGRENLNIQFREGRLEKLVSLLTGEDRKRMGTLRVLQDWQQRQTLTGYLTAARYHYSVALHSVRRFAFFRRRISSARLNKFDAQNVRSEGGEASVNVERAETHRWNFWPSFVNLTAASSLVDLSETLLAGQTTVLILRDLNSAHSNRAKGQSEPSLDFAQLSHQPQAMQKLLKVLNKWFESPNKPSRPSDFLTKSIDRLMGTWEEEVFTIRQSGPKEQVLPSQRQVSFAQEADRPTTAYLALFLGYAGANFTRRAGYATNACGEYEAVLDNILRLLKNLRVMGRLSEDDIAPDCRLPEQVRVQWHHETLSFVDLLAEAAVHIARDRVQPVLKARSNWRQGGYNLGLAVPVSLAAIMCELDVTLRNLMNNSEENPKTEKERNAIKTRIWELEQITHSWFNDYAMSADMEEAQQASDASLEECDRLPCPQIAGARGRARLLRILYRHHFPAMTAMNVQKAVVDDVLLTAVSPAQRNSMIRERMARTSETRAQAEEAVSGCLSDRRREALNLLADLSAREKVFDAPMHFTPLKLAESLTLAVVLHSDEEVSSDLKSSQAQFDPGSGSATVREVFHGEAVQMLGRAVGSFTMGREYYNNINRLYYLYDDFNDRARHSAHAQSMFCADLLGVYSSILGNHSDDA